MSLCVVGSVTKGIQMLLFTFRGGISGENARFFDAKGMR